MSSSPEFSIALRARRWRVSHAEVVLVALERSGLSLARFARRHGLHVKRLARWRARLREGRSARPAPGRPLQLVEVTLREDQEPGSEVELVPRPSPPSLRLAVTVGQATVDIPVGFDQAHLRRVVATLAELC
jgi:transposase-like protein